MIFSKQFFIKNIPYSAATSSSMLHLKYLQFASAVVVHLFWKISKWKNYLKSLFYFTKPAALNFLFSRTSIAIKRENPHKFFFFSFWKTIICSFWFNIKHIKESYEEHTINMKLISIKNITKEHLQGSFFLNNISNFLL